MSSEEPEPKAEVGMNTRNPFNMFNLPSSEATQDTSQESSTNQEALEEVLEETPEEAIPEGIPESGQEIGASAEALVEDELDQQDGLSLGDHVMIRSVPYDVVKGIVWYFDTTKLRVKSDGSNKVFDFGIEEDGSWDPELDMLEDPQTKDDYGLFLLEEGPRPAVSSILELLHLRVEQTLDIFTEEGVLEGTYTIINVNAEQNRIRIKDSTGGEKEFDLTQPYPAMRVRERPAEAEKPVSAEEAAQEEDELALHQAEGGPSALALSPNSDEGLSVVSIAEIELDEIQIAREISESEKIIDELTQKSDFLRDLLSMYDETQQKNPVTLRRIRDLVEMTSALKNSIIRRNQAGVPIGEEEISVRTLDDLFNLRTSPLVRPILNTVRLLLNDMKEQETKTLNEEGIVIQPQYGFQEESTKVIETLAGLPAEISGFPRWFQVLNQYFQEYPTGDIYPGGSYQLNEDSEFFRMKPPVQGGGGGDGGVFGLPPLLASMKVSPSKFEATKVDLEPLIRQIPMSLRRGIGPTYGLGEKTAQLISAGVRANALGYVLFPYTSVRDGLFGSTRPGSIFDSILRSLPPQTTLADLLAKVGERATTASTETLDAQKMLIFSTEDSTAVRISMTDYLTQLLQGLNPRGPGDLHILQANLGIQDQEFTLEQQTAITKRVDQIRQALRMYITGLRTKLEKGREATKQENLLGPTVTASMNAAVKGLSELETLVKEFELATPSYVRIDLAFFSYLFKYAQEYFLAALGGDARRITRERIRYVRDVLVKQYANEREYQHLLASAGHPPEENKCPHVKELEAIRAIEDTTDRMKMFLLFTKQFKGDVDGNWYNCLLCSKHLICRHEFLQLQQFLHPRERDTLQKEIVIAYSGGLVGEHYSCKNCGRPIADLEFDTNLEYDDEGRPLAGRSVIVDKDAVQSEALEAFFEVPVEEESEDVVYENDDLVRMYKIVKTICDKFYIRLSEEQMRKTVERGVFAAKQENMEFTEAKYKLYATKNKLDILFAEYKALNSVAIASASVLLTIQSAIPDIAPFRWLSQCSVRSFGGFPLKADAKPELDEESPGLAYMLCGTKEIVKRLQPWILFSQTIHKREKGVKVYKILLTEITRRLAQNSDVQNGLDEKRAFLEIAYGSTALEKDSDERLPPNFLPRMKSTREMIQDSATQPVIPEGVRGYVAEGLVADAWIRGANKRAEPTALIIRGSPFAETTCCFNSVSTPGHFFKDGDLPPQPKHRRQEMPHRTQSLLYTPIVPRPLEGFNATPSLDVAFRVFLKLCYKGPRKGLPHELGPDNICDWCEIRIPTKFLYPDVDKEGTLIIPEQEIFVELEAQGIPINPESFQSLLDVANQKSSFTPYVAPKPKTAGQLWTSLANMSYPPFEPSILDVEDNGTVVQSETFGQIIQDIFIKMKDLAPTASDVERATKLSSLSSAIEPLQDTLVTTLDMGVSPLGPTDTFVKTLLLFIRQGPILVFQGLRTYFLLGAQSLLTGTGSTITSLHGPDHTLKEDQYIVPKRFKLGKDVRDRLESAMVNHLVILPVSLENVSSESPYQKAKMKLEYFSSQLSELNQIATEFTVARLRYGKVPQGAIYDAMQILLKAFVLGPLAQLVDSSFMPPTDDGIEFTEDQGLSDSLLIEFAQTVLRRLRTEFISYSPMEVRKFIERKKEIELQRFIERFDRLSLEERKVEQEKKTLKIGEWGVGMKLKKYDPETLEQLREGALQDYARMQGMAPDGTDGDEYSRTIPFDSTGFLASQRGRAAEEGYDIRFHSEDIDE
jgi:hypothetical protein